MKLRKDCSLQRLNPNFGGAYHQFISCECNSSFTSPGSEGGTATLFPFRTLGDGLCRRAAFTIRSFGVDCRTMLRKETSFGESEGKTLESSPEELPEGVSCLPLFPETIVPEDSSAAVLFATCESGRPGGTGGAGGGLPLSIFTFTTYSFLNSTLLLPSLPLL